MYSCERRKNLEFKVETVVSEIQIVSKMKPVIVFLLSSCWGNAYANVNKECSEIANCDGIDHADCVDDGSGNKTCSCLQHYTAKDDNTNCVAILNKECSESANCDGIDYVDCVDDGSGIPRCSCVQHYTANDDNTTCVAIYGPENVIFSPPAAEYIKREGEILHTITCVSDCYPGCTYIWNNGSSDVSLTNTLSLGRLHRMDAATYFCLARNYESGVTRERNLTLHILHSPRPVAATNSVITATPGTTVILSLTVIAYPAPMEYFWYKWVINDWIELYNFATVTKERTSLQFNLTISSFKKEDYGEYKLTVDNGVGNHMTYVFTVKMPDNTGLLVLSVCLGGLLVISLLTIGVIASKIFLFRKGRMVQGRYKDGNISAGSGTDDVQISTFEGTNASTVPRDADATNDHVYDEVKRHASQEHAYGQLGSNTGSFPKLTRTSFNPE